MTQANTAGTNWAALETLHIKDSVTFFLVSCVCHRSHPESDDHHRHMLEKVHISGGELVLGYHSLTNYAYNWLKKAVLKEFWEA